MARSADLRAALLIVFALAALSYGIWQLATGADLRAVYWLGAGGLALKAASDRERFLATR